MSDGNQIHIRVRPQDVDIVNKILESYEGAGVLSTVDKYQAQLVVYITPDTRTLVHDILTHLPDGVHVEFLDG